MGSIEDSNKKEERDLSKNNEESADPRGEPSQDDRRAQSRTETILSEIEDATYKVLRKHGGKKSE